MPTDLVSNVVYVVDAWDDDAQESYVRVFTTAEKAKQDLARWQARREGHNLFAGVLKRTIL
ncbi:MAG TPA: hypothetical protein VGQ83_26910 [Polyangia bacterium]|jgi:hypothetical protein